VGEDIEKKVRQILSDLCGMPVKSIKFNSSLIDDLGLDSFGKLELAYAIQEAFGVNLMKYAASIPLMLKVKDIVMFLKSAIKE